MVVLYFYTTFLTLMYVSSFSNALYIQSIKDGIYAEFIAVVCVNFHWFFCYLLPL